jgi:hypothetical protein
MQFRFLPVASLAYLLVIIFLAGCATEHVAYHSTASVPYFTRSTSTQMDLVGESDDRTSRGYVVFVATDNEEISYVLLAPEKKSTGYTFEDANLGRAVPLQKSQASVLIDGLNHTLQLWGKPNEESEGSFYEFLHAPEQDIDRLSPNVVEWSASVKFTASNTPEGPTARLLLGDSPKEALRYVVEFDERKEVSTLRDLLHEAREQIGEA